MIAGSSELDVRMPKALTYSYAAVLSTMRFLDNSAGAEFQLERQSAFTKQAPDWQSKLQTYMRLMISSQGKLTRRIEIVSCLVI